MVATAEPRLEDAAGCERLFQPMIASNVAESASRPFG